MGIVEQELGSFELSDGTDVTIEYNTNGAIHLHIDDIRIDLSPNELVHLADVSAEALDELHDKKQI